jgi:hypothetical protein
MVGAYKQFVHHERSVLGHYQPCLACGESGMDRLSHIVLCKQFWQPVYRAAGTEQRRVLVSKFLCDANAARRAGVAFRAHASIRSPGLLQWQEAFTAAARWTLVVSRIALGASRRAWLKKAYGHWLNIL